MGAGLRPRLIGTGLLGAGLLSSAAMAALSGASAPIVRRRCRRCRIPGAGGAAVFAGQRHADQLFDLPNVPETYVHRIGRTARAGAAGAAISLCDGEERAYLRDIERLIGQKVPVFGRPGATQRRAA